MVDILGTRMSFAKLRLHVTHQKQKLRTKMKVLRFWAQQTKLKVLNALRNNIEYRFSKREQAFKVYLFE